jgi:hypothetical protein
VDAGIEADLAAYRERIAPDRFAVTRRRARAARLRLRLDLPRLGA